MVFIGLSRQAEILIQDRRSRPAAGLLSFQGKRK